MQSDISGSSADAVIDALEAVLERYFPQADQRVLPASVSGSGGAFQWPTVSSSRGKALMWLTQTSTWSSGVAPQKTQGMFVAADGLPIQARNSVTAANATATQTFVEQGNLVRSRLDVELTWDAADRQATVEAGVFLLSTDFPPDVAADPMPWPSAVVYNKSSLLLSLGQPVSCNSVTTSSDGLNCTADMFESSTAILQMLPTAAPTSAPTSAPTALPPLSTSSACTLISVAARLQALVALWASLRVGSF